jgi:hypothetical protein
MAECDGTKKSDPHSCGHRATRLFLGMLNDTYARELNQTENTVMFERHVCECCWEGWSSVSYLHTYKPGGSPHIAIDFGDETCPGLPWASPFECTDEQWCDACKKVVEDSIGDSSPALRLLFDAALAAKPEPEIKGASADVFAQLNQQHFMRLERLQQSADEATTLFKNMS